MACCEKFEEFRGLSKLVTNIHDYSDESLDIEYNKGSECFEVSTEKTYQYFYFEFCPFCGKAIEQGG